MGESGSQSVNCLAGNNASAPLVVVVKNTGPLLHVMKVARAVVGEEHRKTNCGAQLASTTTTMMTERHIRRRDMNAVARCVGGRPLGEKHAASRTKSFPSRCVFTLLARCCIVIVVAAGLVVVGC